MAIQESSISRRREARRSEIIEAAWHLTRTQGLAALSLRELAAAVGMRAPSLYEYFDGKDAIYDAMFAEGWQALAAAVRMEPTNHSTQERVLESVYRYLDFCAEDPARYQLMFTRAIPGWEPSPEAYKASVAAYAEFGTDLATVGIVAPADIDLFTALTAGLASQQAANEPGGDRYKRLAPVAVQMYFDQIKRQGTLREEERS